jgi:glutaminyl-tRNA synthetase
MDFIEEAVAKSAKEGQKIIVRYPPEPNGYMHIGHAKAFSISYGMKCKYAGIANLRFDDTNPGKESMHYVESIKKDISWLRIEYDNVFFASDYYGRLFDFAVHLIKKGLAYVDDSAADEIKNMRGDLNKPGIESLFRTRNVKENLDLFNKMRDGAFPDGARVLRAKIDMTSPNMNMRDPVIYRINREEHYRTKQEWCIYPMYDFAHSLSDYIEHISHSLCSLEFEDHRPLYNWFVEKCRNALPDLPEILPRQYEFSRLNIERFVMSKRWLKKFVEEKLVDGWDDPRMPTISGLRNRGYPPMAIRDFVESTGVTKNVTAVPVSALEYYVRQHLDPMAIRVSVVENPIRVVITNYPENKTETFTVQNNPHCPDDGFHEMTFSREIYIDGEDFSTAPPPKYKRLTVGGTVQLRGAYKIKCVKYVGGAGRDESDKFYLECEITDEKASGVIQYVDKKSGAAALIREFEPLLKSGTALTEENINRDSLHIKECIIERWLHKRNDCETKYQFVRKGYYVLHGTEDGNIDSKQVYNKTISLKESF